MSRKRRTKKEVVPSMREEIMERDMQEDFEDEDFEDVNFEDDDFDDGIEYIDEDADGDFLPAESKKKKYHREKKHKKHSKMKFVIGLVIVLVVLAIAIYVGIRFFGGSDEDPVYVEQVSSLMGLGSADGTIGRYAGVVESQKTTDVKSDSEMNVAKVKVSEGQEIKKGTTLFTYDLTSINEQLEQKKLEYDQKTADIEDSQSNIKEYQSSRAQVKSEREKLSYTIQMKEEENTIKSIQYQQKSLKKEIESLEKASKNRRVKSKLAGIVKSIKKDDGSDTSSDDSATNSTQVTITIMATGSYRVKAKVNEQNVSDVENAENMLVYSRVESEKFWKGAKTTIDYDGTMSSGTQTDGNAETDSMDTESMDSEMTDTEQSTDDTTTSTSYTFYVDLDTTDGLLLGQHVYVEPDNGQSSVKDGVWLASYYVCDIETNSYVWGEKNGKLKKVNVELGDYDAELDEYEIKAGLDREDYIAFPMDSLKEGAKAEHAAAEDLDMDSNDDSEDVTDEESPDMVDEESLDVTGDESGELKME